MGHYHKENLTQCDLMGTWKTSNMNDIPWFLSDCLFTNSFQYIILQKPLHNMYTLKLIHRDISSAYFFLIVDLRERGSRFVLTFYETLFYNDKLFWKLFSQYKIWKYITENLAALSIIMKIVLVSIGISLGNIHALRNQDLGFSHPPPSPLCDYVIHGCSLRVFWGFLRKGKIAISMLVVYRCSSNW